MSASRLAYAALALPSPQPAPLPLTPSLSPPHPTPHPTPTHMPRLQAARLAGCARRSAAWCARCGPTPWPWSTPLPTPTTSSTRLWAARTATSTRWGVARRPARPAPSAHPYSAWISASGDGSAAHAEPRLPLLEPSLSTRLADSRCPGTACVPARWQMPRLATTMPSRSASPLASPSPLSPQALLDSARISPLNATQEGPAWKPVLEPLLNPGIRSRL